jgi:hypothetical protein
MAYVNLQPQRKWFQRFSTRGECQIAFRACDKTKTRAISSKEDNTSQCKKMRYNKARETEFDSRTWKTLRENFSLPNDKENTLPPKSGLGYKMRWIDIFEPVLIKKVRQTLEKVRQILRNIL